MTPIDITNKNTYPALRQRADDLIRDDQAEECYALAAELELALNKQMDRPNADPAEYREVEQIMYDLKWSVLYLYTDTAILSLFQNHFVDVLSHPDIDVMGRLKTFLISYSSVEERDAFKRKVIHALETNQEALTEVGVKKDGKLLAGTVANWLLDFRVALGTQEVAAADLANYLVSSENAKSLNTDDRDRLKNLLSLNERLKLSSQTPEGHESPIPIDSPEHQGVIIDGIFYKSDQNNIAAALQSAREILAKVNGQPAPTEATKPEVPARPGAPATPSAKEKAKPLNNQQAVELYEQDPAMRQAIADEEQKILSAIGSGQLDVRAELGTAIARSDRARVVALLIVLAKTQDLFTLIEKDADFRRWLKSQYGPTAETQFDRQPAEPLFYSLWLQQLLEERLGMGAADAAKIATLLANIIGRRYLKVAYLDTGTGRFAWAPIRQQKDRLTFEG